MSNENHFIDTHLHSPVFYRANILFFDKSWIAIENGSRRPSETKNSKLFKLVELKINVADFYKKLKYVEEKQTKKVKNINSSIFCNMINISYPSTNTKNIHGNKYYWNSFPVVRTIFSGNRVNKTILKTYLNA